ncbi:MAG: hypothetical protein ACOCZ2_00285 [Thermodesulfobacteriota bacterium]
MWAKVTAISLIRGSGYRTLRHPEYRSFASMQEIYSILRQKDTLFKPVNNFSRLDPIAKSALCTAGLAVTDAAIAKDKQSNLGIIGESSRGCLEANTAYFRDYVDNGRQQGRGKLFVYTLPSTPLAETAIALGCQGPLFYTSFSENPLYNLLEQASQLADPESETGMIAVYADRDMGLGFILQPTENKSSLSIQEALNWTSRY